MENPQKRLKMNIILSMVAVLTVMAVSGTLLCSNAYAQESSPQETVLEEAHPEKAGNVNSNGLYAAAVAFAAGALGAGIAISYVGSAAMGAIAEKPQIAGQALIFVALAEGIVVFGFITALMILGKV